MIAAILLEPEPHAGKTYPHNGPVEMTQSAVARVRSGVLGRPVEFELVSLEQFRRDIEVSLERPFLAQHLYEAARNYGNGIFVGTNDVILRVTGKPAMSLEAFARAPQNRVLR